MTTKTPTPSTTDASPSDLHAFYDFVGEKLSLNQSSLTPADVFEEWLLSHSSDEDDCTAIQQALDEMDAGDRGTPWDVFDAEFRQKHNLPPRS